MTEKYHKIENIFNRDEKTHKLIKNDWKNETFKYLRHNKWIFTEKVDGTNIRVIYQNGEVEFRGKSDNADIPKMLIEKLKELFPSEKLKKVFGESNICLYGEGYGFKIHKGGGYLKDSNGFALFDVHKGDHFLCHEDMKMVADSLSIKICPTSFIGSLLDAVIFCRKGFNSKIAESNILSEGLVGKPAAGLLGPKGGRIIVKIKHKDLI
jgi:hypothetical protein